MYTINLKHKNKDSGYNVYLVHIQKKKIYFFFGAEIFNAFVLNL